VSDDLDLAAYLDEQTRARDLGFGYTVLRHIILQANSDAEDGISMGRAVELIREMGLRAVDKAVAEERGNVVAFLRYEAERLTGTNTTDAFRASEYLGASADEIARGEHLRAEGESE
jgi:hypothetical protein